MAFSFTFWHDVSMTQEFDWDAGDKLSFSVSGDDVLYFGSTDTLVECSKSGGGDIVITPSHTMDEWAASTAYSTSDEVRTTTQLGYYFECTTAGTSGASEPSWATAATEGNTIADGTVTWTNRGALHEITEIKLANTAGGLATATAGASLTITAPLAGGTASPIHIRMTDATGGGVASNHLYLGFDTLAQSTA